MTIRLLSGLIVLALAVGCSSPPPPRPGAAARDVAAEAMAAVARGDWPQAGMLLREALSRDPASAKLHYHLAVAATNLDRRDEAIREFQWVLANVAPELPDAVEARRWLTEAGVLAGPGVATPAPSERITEETPGDSGVQGQILWADGQPTTRLQIFLKGAPKSPNEGLQWVMRTDEYGRFDFKRIPAGTYMLTNKVAGAPTWRLRVQVAPGEVVTLDLSEANSAKVRDDFPGA
jgi:tetratricopeptide (TPR) repeat protein